MGRGKPCFVVVMSKWGHSLALHVYNTYLNILIILIMPDIGKVSVVGTPSNFGLFSLDITGFFML